MRKKEKFINRLQNNSKNEDYFISPADVGEIWQSSNRIQNSQSYDFNLAKKEKINNFNFKTTKEFTDKLLDKFSTQKSTSYSHITENIEESSFKEENIFSKHSLVFLNFLDVKLNNLESIKQFTYKFGLLGDPDHTSINTENLFLDTKRIEPIALWAYEQGCLQYAYSLWEEVKKYDKNPKKLLQFYKAKPGHKYAIKSNYCFEENFTKTGEWEVNREHSNILNISKNLVSLILQDHMEHRISLKTNFIDFKTPTPILETDSLLAVIWLSFLKYIQEGYKEIKKCRECNYKFNAIDKRKEFCSNECKIKYHNNN